MTIHGRIQERLKNKYELMGYKVSVEVGVENDLGSYYVIDVLATKGNETIAIEIGNITKPKEDFLKRTFTKYIHIPQLVKTQDGFIIHHYCGHTWKPRKEHPKECPNCKARIYNETR